MESKVADAATFGAICNPDGGPKPLKFQRKIGLQSFIINNGTAPISAVFEEEQTCKHDGWNKAGSEWYSHWIAGREEVEAAGGQVTVLALKPGSNPDRP